MAYGFHFELPGKFIYYEGCEKEKEARIKLEEMAMEYCRNVDLGIGKVLRIEDGESEILSRYRYSFKEGELVIVNQAKTSANGMS